MGVGDALVLWNSVLTFVDCQEQGVIYLLQQDFSRKISTEECFTKNPYAPLSSFLCPSDCEKNMSFRNAAYKLAFFLRGPNTMIYITKSFWKYPVLFYKKTFVAVVCAEIIVRRVLWSCSASQPQLFRALLFPCQTQLIWASCMWIKWISTGIFKNSFYSCQLKILSVTKGLERKKSKAKPSF